MVLRATKDDEDADAGARFGLSWSGAVAGRAFSLFLPGVFN
jgi:hypothetical protein